MRERLVPRRPGARPGARAGAHAGAAGCVPGRAAVDAARARRLAGDAARSRAALLALAPARLSPAAARHAGARARSRALPPHPRMQARIVETARGARWIAEGWRLFRAAPLGWLAAVFGYWLLMTLISLVPFIGLPAAALLVPAFSVGFMALARAARHQA